MSTIGVFAHPGRTDQNGGHWDRKNGTYHFHTGEHAGKSSGGSSSKSEYIPFTPPYEPPTDNPYRSDSTKKNANSKSETFLGTVCSMFAVTFGFAFIVFVISTITEFICDGCLEKHLPRYKISILMEKLNDFQYYQTEITEINNDLFNLKQKYKIPNLYEISTDNLPKDKNSSLHWGTSFTLYKTDNGTKLHAKYKCCNATNPMHIYNYRNYSDFSELLCKKCAGDYAMPDMSWYENYLKYEQAVSRLKNMNDNCDNLQKEIKELHKKCNSIKTKILIIFNKETKKSLQESNNKFAEMQTIKQLSQFNYAENEV